MFEVDHPASQRDKQRRLGDLAPDGRAGRAGRRRPRAANHSPRPSRQAGFDPALETTWVWEGVVPYLTAEAVEATVGQVAELSAPGSLLVVNYQSGR